MRYKALSETKIRGSQPVKRTNTLLTDKSPEQVSNMIVTLSGISESSRILEPSAGNGTLADVLYNKCTNITAIELNKTLYQRLSYKPYKTLNKDFLLVTSDDIGKFTHVIACPPYGSVPHLNHMKQFITPSGIIFALVIFKTLDEYWKKFYTKLSMEFVNFNNEVLECGLVIYSHGDNPVDLPNVHILEEQF